MDTNFIEQAFQAWKEQNHDRRAWWQLSMGEMSKIAQDAQKLKDNAQRKPVLTVDEVLDRSRRAL